MAYFTIDCCLAWQRLLSVIRRGPVPHRGPQVPHTERRTQSHEATWVEPSDTVVIKHGQLQYFWGNVTHGIPFDDSLQVNQYCDRNCSGSKNSPQGSSKNYDWKMVLPWCFMIGWVFGWPKIVIIYGWALMNSTYVLADKYCLVTSTLGLIWLALYHDLIKPNVA